LLINLAQLRNIRSWKRRITRNHRQTENRNKRDNSQNNKHI